MYLVLSICNGSHSINNQKCSIKRALSACNLMKNENIQFGFEF